MSTEIKDVSILASICALFFPPLYFVSRKRYGMAATALAIMVLGTFFIALGGFIPLILLVFYSANDARKQSRAFNVQLQANQFAAAMNRNKANE